MKIIKIDRNSLPDTFCVSAVNEFTDDLGYQQWQIVSHEGAFTLPHYASTDLLEWMSVQCDSGATLHGVGLSAREYTDKEGHQRYAYSIIPTDLCTCGKVAHEVYPETMLKDAGLMHIPLKTKPINFIGHTFIIKSAQPKSSEDQETGDVRRFWFVEGEIIESRQPVEFFLNVTNARVTMMTDQASKVYEFVRKSFVKDGRTIEYAELSDTATNPF